MKRLVSLGLFVLGASCMAFAQFTGGGSAPEIDPGQAVTALALLSGATLVLRGRRKK